MNSARASLTWPALVVIVMALASAAAWHPEGAPDRRPQVPPAAGRGSSPFLPPEPLDFANRAGWTPLFDGRTLAGWSGNPEVWSVENGAITAASTTQRRVGSTHIIWTGGEPGDFELKLDIKLEGDIHSGIAYRSAVDPARVASGTWGTPAPAGAPARPALAPPQVPADPRWTLYGPGLDYDYDRKMAGNVEERGTPRREIAWRGAMVRAAAGERPRVVGAIGDPDTLMALLEPDDWNQVHIIARGHQITHIINGQVMTILLDDDPAFFRPAGRIGLQIEMYGTGRVSFREIWLKDFAR